MKNLIVSIVLVALVTLSVNAQEKKWEASVNFIYGQFTDDFSKEIYSDGFSGFEIEVSSLIVKNWLGAGLYYEGLSSSGTPISYGYDGVDEKVDMNMNTFGLEVFVRPFKFVDVYTRYGTLSLKEVLDSNIGYVEFDEKGNTFDIGVRFNVLLSKRLNLQAKAETTSVKLNDLDIDGAADNYSFGLGLGYRF